MTAISELATQITKSVKRLPAKQMREVMSFIGYLETNEDASFIEYVNERTRKAVQEKMRGKHFTTLKEFDPSEFEGAAQLNMTVEEIDHECRKMRNEWERAF